MTSIWKDSDVLLTTNVPGELLPIFKPSKSKYSFINIFRGSYKEDELRYRYNSIDFYKLYQEILYGGLHNIQ